MLIRLFFGISLFLLSSCSNISNESELELKRGLFYNTSNGKPFSGKVYKLYNNGSKMREAQFDIGAIEGSYTYYDNEGSIIYPADEASLDFRDGKKYFANSDKEFWGLAFGTYQSGETSFEVLYENGKVVGDYVYFNRDGSIKSPIFTSLLIRRGDVLYQESSPEPYTGPVFDLWENGNKMLEGSYKNSVKDGRWMEWFDNGQPEKQYNYRYGLRHGYWAEWHSNGFLSIEGSYIDGKEDGTWTYWYPSGQKEKIIMQKEGWWNGRSQKWFLNGQRM